MKTFKIIYAMLCVLITLFILFHSINILIYSMLLGYFDIQIFAFLIMSFGIVSVFWLLFKKFNPYLKTALFIILFIFTINYLNIADKIPTVNTVSTAIQCVDFGGVWDKEIKACKTRF